ncbi:hypothetical protein BGZ95_010232 [Linnemannia exigua]|uniref:Uncharacterized protein n=1 Tax=Linnemannia exigua TaxID=604196 RepID=A0AAD4DKC7_9FUNG|nr:hypothetical protein BGZ95_010232 [Linnemannia exigua]
MASQQTTAIPAFRHHRRSVDRVLPPALEVRLARLSIDEGETKSAHIVPAPPSLPLRMGMLDVDRGDNYNSSQDSFSSGASSNNSNNSSLESIVEGTPSTYTNTNRLGKLGTSPDKGTSTGPSSMLSPQAPSALLQIDQQHQQNYHQPNISVQYHRRSRSGSQLLGDSRYFNKTTDTGGGGGGPAFFSAPLFTQKQQEQGVGTAAVVYSASPIMLDTTDFGEDLFHWDSLEIDNGFGDSPTIPTTTPATSQQLGSIVASSNPRPHPHRQAGIYKCDGSMNECDSSLLESTSTYHTPPTMYSPSRKGPLSAASSQASSRGSSPLSDHRSPLGELSEDGRRIGDQWFEFSQAKAQDLHVNAMENTDGSNYLDIPEMDEDRLLPGSPMSIGAMSNEQDRWKSPTLSALASGSSSRGPSPRSLSPSPLSQRSAMVMAMPSRHGNYSMDREHVLESVVDDMNVEIPMIETRDEVPLQDIWRMEDEERKDRLNGAGASADGETAGGGGDKGGSVEGHNANMKGEQHAHQEARLIQEAIDALFHEAL